LGAGGRGFGSSSSTVGAGGLRMVGLVGGDVVAFFSGTCTGFFPGSCLPDWGFADSCLTGGFFDFVLSCELCVAVLGRGLVLCDGRLWAGVLMAADGVVVGCEENELLFTVGVLACGC
jgi:hypothetical protein